MNTQPAIPNAMRDSLFAEMVACGYSQPDRMAVWGCVVVMWEPEIARLRRIETAARDAVDSGQAQYEAEEQYIGDLIPAAKMMSLAEAVHGAKVDAGKPPAASDEYARELEAALEGEATS